MEIIIEKGCGLDVHKETVVACIMGTGIRKEIRTYTTMTNDLLRLKGWLQETGDNACGHGKYRGLLEACFQHLRGSL